MATCKECLHVDCYDQSLEDAETCNFFLPKEDYQLVVRCKECTNKKLAIVNRNGILICPISDIKDDDYCSYGYRTREAD